MFVIFVFVGKILIVSLVLVQVRGVRVVMKYVQTAPLLLTLGQICLIFADRGGKISVIVYSMVMSVYRVSTDTASTVVNGSIIIVEALLWNSSEGFGIVLVILLNVCDGSNLKVAALASIL